MIDQQIATPRMTLRNGRDVTIRPLGEHDRAKLLAFGQKLPHDDLLYLEDDFQSADIIARLVNAYQAENWRQFVVEAGDEIVGYSSARRLVGWSSHVADIVLLVSPEWRRAGVGVALAQAIFDAARDLGVSKVIVEMLEEQQSGRAIFERLGFSVEGTLTRHSRDRHGNFHNLLILSYHIA
ncbi:MAG TPA: GNAT family N-acetyltransferase [Kouleothrix sp.]|uniref:GNAT family N-acetyltransferase n=1 Tax=Kouleothrix sp. TaxID=2779161 RepID=UPI002C421FD6|nr:GNAT family N-acetyltransferase [Kouleothrix sp.]HRC75465.1 GNAT family N-acetyltransferase [Kouleothrix sp.]